MKNKTLGRGLKELLEENNIDDIKDGEVVQNINLSEIEPNPFQPRKIFDEEKILDLSKSIKEQGVVQPIILKKMQKGYIIVSGERRYRASKLLKLESIPAIIRPYELKKVAEIALIENLQREDLTCIEEATAYQNIINEFNYTQKEVADKVGKSRSHITNMLGLLNLPLKIQDLVLKKEISMGHARVLSKLKDEKRIDELAKIIIEKNLSVRDIEELSQQEKKIKEIKKKVKNPYYKDLEKKFFKKFNLKMKISDNKLIIKYDNIKDLDRIINIFKSDNDV